MIVFFFKQKTAYEMRISDWSSDVCSSDLVKSTVADLARAVDPIYPPKPEPAVSAEIHVTTVPIATPRAHEPAPTVDGGAGLREVVAMLPPDEFWGDNTRLEIGRASCRERVCQYV